MVIVVGTKLEIMGLIGIMCLCFRLALVEMLLFTAAATATTAIAKPGCPDHCGDLKIPFPFGTNPDCFLNDDFLITCNETSTPPKPFLMTSNIAVTNITMEGRLQIQTFVSKACFNKAEIYTDANTPYLRLAKRRVSETQNKFTVIGCDSYAYINGKIGDRYYTGGCISKCGSRGDVISDGHCYGSGCCQIDIPKGLTYINFTAYRFETTANAAPFNPCTFAFVIEETQFQFSPRNLSYAIAKTVPTVVDWAIAGQGNCGEAEKNSSYACKENAECDPQPPDSNGADSYLCKCMDGFDGNPYLGCQDIDECREQGKHTCHKNSYCENIKGNYTCKCKEGYQGDGRGEEGCIANQLLIIKIVLGGGIGFVILLVCCSWLYLILKKRRLIKLKEKFFQQNGGLLLQQQLSKRSSSSDHTAKIFTAEELKKATNNFDERKIIGRGGFGTVYKGFLTENNDTPVAIKKSKIVDQSQIEQFINEVTVLSQINHRNVVKLLGCCLETQVPLLVYEYVSNGTLFEHIHDKDKTPGIPWETRMRIAAESAGVLSYLHSAAATPIIHRDVKSTNILLDDNYTAEVSDFGASKLVPMDVTQLSTMVQGTLGYLDPEYFHTSQLTEKSDVYSFGVVLVELMTGKKVVSFDRPEEERSLAMYFLVSFNESRLFEILDDDIVNKDNTEQIREVGELARRCLRVKGEERPTMKEVAMELEGLRRMHKHLWDNVEVDMEGEREHLLSTTSYASNYGGDGSSNLAAVYDSLKDNVLVDFDGGR